LRSESSAGGGDAGSVIIVCLGRLRTLGTMVQVDGDLL
jgi:hypothetical protein